MNSLPCSLGYSIDAGNHCLHFFQKIFHRESEPGQIEGPQRGEMRGEHGEAGFFCEVGLLVLGVAVSDSAQAAEQVAHRNYAGENRIAFSFAGRMMACNHLDQFSREIPVAPNDFTALTMCHSQEFLLNFVQWQLPFAGGFKYTPEFMRSHP